MSETRHGRFYWHCHVCDRFVPREQEHCACGAPKGQRKQPRKPPSRLGGAGILFAAGVVLLWLVMLWIVLRDQLPAAPPSRRRGALLVPAMTHVALALALEAPHTHA